MCQINRQTADRPVLKISEDILNGTSLVSMTKCHPTVDVDVAVRLHHSNMDDSGGINSTSDSIAYCSPILHFANHLEIDIANTSTGWITYVL